jgi:hypothetical protein
MLKAVVVRNVVVACPVCGHDRHQRLDRSDSPQGHVSTRCACDRCGAIFVLEEDRAGRPVVRGA